MDAIDEIIENEQEDDRDLAEIFKKKIVTLFGQGASLSTANTKAQEYVNIQYALPSFITGGGISSDHDVCDRALQSLYDKLNERKHQREVANELKKKSFLKRCTNLEEKWQREDEGSIQALNLPKLNVDIGRREYRKQGLTRIYCSPDYPMTRMEMTRECKPDGFNIVLPSMMKLNLGKTEVHAGKVGKMFMAKTPVTEDIDPRMLGRHHIYCGRNRRLPKEDERFLALDRQLSELPWNRKKSILLLLKEEAKREKEEARTKSVLQSSPKPDHIRWATPLTMKPIAPKIPKDQPAKQERRISKTEPEIVGDEPESEVAENADGEIPDVQDDGARHSPDGMTEGITVVVDHTKGLDVVLETPTQDTQPPESQHKQRHHVFNRCIKVKNVQHTPMKYNPTTKRVKTADKPSMCKSCERISHELNTDKARPSSVDRSPPSRSKRVIIRDMRTKRWKEITKEYGIGLLRSCDGEPHRPRTHAVRHKRCHFPSLRREHTVA
jgi:hypothetical protein